MTDKNLGPAVIERDVYIKRVFDDHLLKTDTYRRIEPTEAAEILTTIKTKVDQFTKRPSLKSYQNMRRNSSSDPSRRTRKSPPST